MGTEPPEASQGLQAAAPIADNEAVPPAPDRVPMPFEQLLEDQQEVVTSALQEFTRLSIHSDEENVPDQPDSSGFNFFLGNGFVRQN